MTLLTLLPNPTFRRLLSHSSGQGVSIFEAPDGHRIGLPDAHVDSCSCTQSRLSEVLKPARRETSNARSAEEPILERLHLQYNRIHSLPPSFLDGIRSLRFLDLSNNKLGTLESTVFQDTPLLQELFLQGNELHTLHKDTLKGLTKLKLLILANNNLDELDGALLHDTQNIMELDLNSNYLTYLPQGFLMGLRGLRWVDLHNNRLEELDNDLFGDVDNLEQLWLGCNNLSRLPLSIAQMSARWMGGKMAPSRRRAREAAIGHKAAGKVFAATGLVLDAAGKAARGSKSAAASRPTTAPDPVR